jgi:alpha-tubulin suppressor-like RCC1 family protein
VPATVVDSRGNALTGATAVSADKAIGHTCAVFNGTVYCWGDNGWGQLGIATSVASLPYASPVTTLGQDAVEVYTAGYSSCAVLVDTTMKCWGNNTHGQLGNRTPSLFETIPVTFGGL